MPINLHFLLVTIAMHLPESPFDISCPSYRCCSEPISLSIINSVSSFTTSACQSWDHSSLLNLLAGVPTLGHAPTTPSTSGSPGLQRILLSSLPSVISFLFTASIISSHLPFLQSPRKQKLLLHLTSQLIQYCIIYLIPDLTLALVVSHE